MGAESRDVECPVQSATRLHQLRCHLTVSSLVLGFWQYGLMDWDIFYTCLDAIISANDRWAIFHYDEHAPGRKGALCPAECKEYPTPGTYIVDLCRFGGRRGSPSSPCNIEHKSRGTLNRIYNNNINFVEATFRRQTLIESEFALVILTT
jgi:hypothetical protein